MKQKILLLTILLSTFSLSLLAQTFTLQGRVTDENGNPVELCTVSVLQQGKITMTSLKGEFQMHLLSADTVAVRFSMIGYKPKVRLLRKPKGKQTLQITLLEDDNLLSELQVNELRRQTSQTEELDPEKLKNMPSTTGNAVEELVQLQAGVSTHSELSSQYNVRGGSFDENNVYINNVEIFRPFLVRSGQQEGLSVINPDMVERIQFSTGGFEAKYGDKMSSALDITYRRLTPLPAKKSLFEGKASISLLGSGVYLGYATKKLSWMNSLRYKTNKYLLRSMDTHAEYRPTFLDYQTYLSFRPDKKWQIDLIANLSDNHYDFTPEDRETKFGTMESVKSFRVYFDGQEKDLFRTYFGSLSLTRHISDSTSISILASAYRTQERETYDIQGQYWLTQTETSENLGVGTYFEHSRNYLRANVQSLKIILRHKLHRHNLQGALTLKRERIQEKSVEYEMRDSAGYSIPHTGQDLYMIYSLRARNQLNANRLEAYIQDTWRFSSGGDNDPSLPDSLRREPTLYTLNYGVRTSHWNFNRETIFSPRLSLAVIPAWNQQLTLRFATGLYYQAPFFKELRDTSTVNGSTYASLNRKIKSQRSIHFIAALDYRFKAMQRHFKLTAEAYYKLLAQLVPYSVSNVKVVYYGDNRSAGHAAGLDLKLYGEFVPGYDSWITFSIMNTSMKLQGKSIPLPTDQRYAINLYFTDYFPGTDRWRMSLKLAYADGLPFAAPHQELQNNSFRAPAYRRADIGMSYRLLNNEKPNNKKLPLRNIWIGADCLNLFDISNVNSYYWVTDVTNQQYAVPNYLTRRQINFRLSVEF